MATITPLDGSLVLAPLGFEKETLRELGGKARPVIDGARLFAIASPTIDVAWSANVWRHPLRIRFDDVDDALATLRGLSPRWSALPLARIDDTSRIAKRLRAVTPTPIAFPSEAPTDHAAASFGRPDPLASFALLDAQTLLASTRCSSVFPNGEVVFAEDRRGPPSRAYLKLWEALVRMRRRPTYGDRCIDLGSSPGGWTWALQRLDAWVLSVDKAPLDPRIARLPRVECRRASAFSLDAKSTGNLDWIVSDVICYPERLFAMLDRFLEVHPRASYVVTIKFQGEAEMKPVRDFVDRHGGELVHLHHDKHELTWMRAGEPTRRRRRAHRAR